MLHTYVYFYELCPKLKLFKAGLIAEQYHFFCTSNIRSCITVGLFETMTKGHAELKKTSNAKTFSYVKLEGERDFT